MSEKSWNKLFTVAMLIMFSILLFMFFRLSRINEKVIANQGNIIKLIGEVKDDFRDRSDFAIKQRSDIKNEVHAVEIKVQNIQEDTENLKTIINEIIVKQKSIEDSANNIKNSIKK